MKLQFFSPCPRGLEPLLCLELTELGAENISTVHGGVKFEGNWEICWKVNLESRLATRVLWKVGHGIYHNEEHIYKITYSVNWKNWFSPENTIRVYVTAVKSPLRSLNFITLKIKDAICDKFVADLGRRPSVDTDNPDFRIHAYITEDACTIYIDTSGEPLYKRGFKLAKARAPLKENLAAGIIKLIDWKYDQPLYDPMCGSGTFLIEAALIALDIAPGLGRHFSFEKLTTFKPEVWKDILNKAKARRKPSDDLKLFASDIEEDQVEATTLNLDAAGLSNIVAVTTGDFLDIMPPSPEGVMVTNPPYGVRLGAENELKDWYPKIGDHLKKNFPGWRCHFLTGDPDFQKQFGLKPSKKIPIMNGDIDCRVLEYKIISGFNRKEKPQKM